MTHTVVMLGSCRAKNMIPCMASDFFLSNYYSYHIHITNEYSYHNNYIFSQIPSIALEKLVIIQLINFFVNGINKMVFIPIT